MQISAGQSMDLEPVHTAGGVEWCVYPSVVAILLSRKWTVEVDGVN